MMNESVKAILVTGEAVSELAGHAVIVFQPVKLEEEVGRVVRFLRRVCEVFVRQLLLCLGRRDGAQLLRGSSNPQPYDGYRNRKDYGED